MTSTTYPVEKEKKPLTPAEDNDSQKQRHVAVVQLQHVELD